MEATAAVVPAEEAVPEFEYRAGWSGRGVLPGAHRSRVRGAGELFREYVPLERHPDPRRLDLRAMARDPLEGVHVRVFERRSALRVYLIADLSGSMHFRAGDNGCLDWLMALARSVAASVSVVGDRFGLIACAGAHGRSGVWPAQRSRAAAFEAIDALRDVAPGTGAENVAEAVHALPRERALVFLASDFHWPLDLLGRVLDGLGQHDCVPVWLRSPASWQWLPRWGLCRLRDLESGRSRLMLLRPGLRERVLQAAQAHHLAIAAAFALRGLEPCVMEGGFSPDRLTEYFRRS